MDYYVERITEKNFSSFLEIFEKSFGKHADAAYFKKKFDTSFSGHRDFGFMAFDKKTNEPAAFYGVFPLAISHNGKKIAIAQSGDTATHPNHRKKGLFALLHEQTMNLGRQENLAYIFGFPNANSYPGFMKFGWSHTANSVNFIRVNKVKFFVKVMRKVLPGLFATYQKNYIAKHTLSESELDRSDLSTSLVVPFRNKFVIERSADYLKYKTRLGSKIIKLEHGLAWISLQGNAIEVGDLFGSKPGLILNDVIRFAEASGFDILNIKLSHREMAAPLDLSAEFKPTESNSLIINRLNDQNIKDEDLYYTGADFDTF